MQEIPKRGLVRTS